MARYARSSAFGAVCLLLTGCSSGPTATHKAEESTSASPASNVQRVEVGGYSLDIVCEGEGSPTVLFEAGSGGDRHALADWVDLHGLTRVCAYDRAGIGTSDPRPLSGATTVGDRADELSRLLDGAGIDEPLVLASHSLGGGIDQFFADRYPDRVAGLVFIDPIAIPGFVAHFGPELEDGTGGTMDMVQTARDWRRLGTFGSIPLFVLTQGFAGIDVGIPTEARRYFRRVHDELAGRSSDSIHVIAKDSGHNIHKAAPSWSPRRSRRSSRPPGPAGSWHLAMIASRHSAESAPADDPTRRPTTSAPSTSNSLSRTRGGRSSRGTAPATPLRGSRVGTG